MSKEKNKIDRQRPQAHKVPARPKKLLAMALGAILVSAPGLAMAQTVNVDAGNGSINNGAGNPSGGAGTNYSDINSITTLPSQQGPNAIVTITADQSVTGTLIIDSGNVANALNNLWVWDGNKNNNARVKLTYKRNTTPSDDRGIYRIENLSAAGEGITIHDLEFVNGYYDTAGDATEASGGGYGGGGLFVGYTTDTLTSTAAQFTGQVSIINTLFSGNEVNVDFTGTEYASISGGGFLVSNNTADPDDVSVGKVALSGVTVTGNIVDFDASTYTGSTLNPSAFGGGGRIVAVGDIAINGSTFSDNLLKLTNGSHARGGGLALETEVAKAGGENHEYTNLTLTGNKIELDGTNLASGFADGAGVYIMYEDYTETFNAGNLVEVTHTFTDSTISGNTAKATVDDSTRLGIARGAGVAVFGKADATFDYTMIKGNTADASDFAFGGGIASMGYGGTQNGANTVEAGLVTVQNGSVVSGNTAKATDLALGGGIYARGDVVISDSSLLDNAVTGENAFGGGLFVDLAARVFEGGKALSGTDTLESFLYANADNTTMIFGNTQNGSENGLYFSSSVWDSTLNQYITAADGALNVEGEGRVLLLDNIVVDLYGSDFTMNVDKVFDGVQANQITGDYGNEFVWGGKNIIDVHNDGGAGPGTYRANIVFESGLTRFTADYSTTAKAGTDMDVYMGDGTLVNNTEDVQIMFNPGRDKNTALFNYETGATGLVYAQDDVQLRVDDERALIRVTGDYLLVTASDDFSYTDAMLEVSYLDDALNGKGGIKNVYTKDGNVYATVDYAGSYAKEIANAGRNTISASYALDAHVDQKEMSDDDFYDIVRDGFRTVTAEYAMDQAMASTRITGAMGDWARKIGLQDPWKRGYNNMPDPCPEGFRLWSGYVGMFNSNDSHGGYRGYDVDTNGFLLGGNWEFAKGAIGIYGGFSKSDTELNGIKSKVETDGVQFGIQGRLTPFEDVPNLAFYGDVAYASYDNDGWRNISGHRIKGSFDQDAWTIGLGVNYAINFDSFALTPFLNLRYTSLDQDGFSEQGWDWTRNKVNGADVDSFTSVLGAEIRSEFTFDGGYFAPFASAGWRHEFGDDQADAKASYIKPGIHGVNNFKLSSLEADTDSADLGLGFDVMFDIGTGGQQLGINVSYEANIGSDSDTQTVYGGLQYRF